MAKSTQSLAPTDEQSSGLSAPAGSVSLALAGKIISAIEGTYRDWLNPAEYAEIKPIIAQIIERELGGWTVQASDYDKLGQCADELAKVLDVLRHPLDDTALRALQYHRELRRQSSPNNAVRGESRDSTTESTQTL